LVQPTKNETTNEEWWTVSGTTDQQATHYISLWRKRQREEWISVSFTNDGL
jgi:hypothetical protein